MDITSFIGLDSYYRRFVDGFESIDPPLTTLTQKNVRFEWSDACEKSIQMLKDKLTSASVITLPKSTKGYVVYYDESRDWLGCVLTQHCKVKAIH